MNEIRSPAAIAEFLFAGHAVFTIQSRKSSEHYTFQFDQAKDWADRYFVSLRTGEDFVYIGVVEHARRQFRTTAKSKLTLTSPAVMALRWFLRAVTTATDLLDQVVFRHEGHCGRCGRQLTNPESIDRGIGPDCWEMMHPAPPRQERFLMAEFERV